MPDITTENAAHRRGRHCLNALEQVQGAAVSARALGASPLDIMRACFGRSTDIRHAIDGGERAAITSALLDLEAEDAMNQAVQDG